MSTLVMVEKDGIACMAADTLTSFGSMKQPAKYFESPEKILHVGDAYLGVVGLCAHLTVLRSAFSNGLSLPEVRCEMDLFEFARELHAKLKEDYCLNPQENGGAYESTRMCVFLVNPFGLFSLYANRSVEQNRRFAAVGSGSDYALGAMYATYASDLPAEEIARIGVEAGAEFDDASQAPITLKKVKLES